MKRTPLRRKAALRAKTPGLRKSHGRPRPGDREAKEGWYAALTGMCWICLDPATELHHVVYAQEVVREGGDLWDRRNAMPICRRCHERHHKRSAPIPLRALPQSALEFALELLGDRTVGYLRRRYVGYDARMESLPGGTDG